MSVFLAIFFALLILAVVVYAMFAIAASQHSLNEYEVPYGYNYYHNVYNDDY